MAASTLHHNHAFSAIIHSYTNSLFDDAERMLRRVGAWLTLCFFMCGELGLAWDIQWHSLIGRDRFWTPPHILIYFGVGGAGLTALVVVLIETLRYRRGVAGVDDSSTVHLFRIFHAPLGFIMKGCGPLIDIIAAPIILQTTAQFLPQGVVYMPPQTVLPLVLSLLLTLVMGYVAGMFGAEVGNIWYRNVR